MHTHWFMNRTGYKMQRWRQFSPISIARLVHILQNDFLSFRLYSRLKMHSVVSASGHVHEFTALPADFTLWWCRWFYSLFSLAQGQFENMKPPWNKNESQTHNQPCFLFEVSCRQFYTSLFYNSALWGKYFLVPRGNLKLQLLEWPQGRKLSQLCAGLNVHIWDPNLTPWTGPEAMRGTCWKRHKGSTPLSK